MSPTEPIYIADETVRALIDEQFPELAGRELGRRYTLEDQFAMRIGDDYGAIFPRLPGRDEHYARVVDLITPHVDRWTFPSSHPIATGVPGHGFPYHWTLVQWISASTAGFVPLHAESARPLGEALREVHTPSPADAPLNPRTGLGLPELEDQFSSLLAFACDRGAPENRSIDADAARAIYEEGEAASQDVSFTWTHGRLEPRAILSDQGAFAGILLWHNFGAGDPAADLGYAANLLSRDMHPHFWAGYGDVSEATAARARAFQVFAALRHIQIDDPFLMRMAWERLMELGLVHEA
ncbi:phosphotransferase [Demequina muriae]|uniref:Phosphotransferase n=1 Tax=Demequina muriae TaxID=3051664 RepID=A0ABT8GGQ3_9MICO|nr:phosphotransferase [Demequina sp. EGI L300058]MDN4480603.1 phosphotransferase [Demequina sp. EGI L300058]